MQVFDLKGEVRNDLGKKATKAVRYAEKVPCVLYGERQTFISQFWIKI